MTKKKPTLARSLGSTASYTDVEAVLQTALRHDTWPVVFTCPTRAAAFRWRARACKYRIVLRRNEEITHDLQPGTGTSLYDNLTFLIRGEGENEVHMVPLVPEGTLTIGGRTVEPTSDRSF